MNRRAFTLIELGAVLTVAAGVAALSAGVVQQPRSRSKQIKDATQIRNIVQAMTIFAQGNKDCYPLPSMIDGNDQTVAEKGRAKDTSANIMSILIFNSSISTELCVSPVETNKKVKNDKRYQFSDPKAAVVGENAVWDPGFSADFTSDKGGNLSYAHLQPSASPSGNHNGGRLPRWSNTFNADEPVVCNRGPEITSVTYTTIKDRKPDKAYTDDPATPAYGNAKSNTFGFYPSGKEGEPSWSGNVAWNDNHVDFIEKHFSPGQPTRTGARYASKEGMMMPDLAFFDEPDDDRATNNFLGVFIKAGNTPAQFKAIWD